jgi:release factor glutamine methyltransferase
MADTWTIQRLLNWTRDWLTQKGSATARLDAELLLAEVLKLRRLDLLMRFDQPLDKPELAAFKALIQRRARGEPVAYILGRKGFHAIDLKVDRRVLVPRPETEALVDQAVALCCVAGAPAGPVLDLCTGSGAIALAMAHALAHADARPREFAAPPEPRSIVASDLSEEALAVARSNGEELGLAVDWRRGDLWHALRPDERFAVIVSNPPYVLSDRIATLATDVRDFEPHLALDGGRDGMTVLASLASGAAEHLLPGGSLVVELGDRGQGLRFAELLATAGLDNAVVTPIQGGPTSMVVARRP